MLLLFKRSINNLIFRISMHKALSILLIIASSFSCNMLMAQPIRLSHDSLKRDSLITDFLLRHDQFYDIPVSDTSNPQRYEIAKYNFFCSKIAQIHKGNKEISFYGFGSNYSHSRNYLLIEENHSYNIIGESSLDDDLPKLYNIFENLGNDISANQRLSCYEFLIRNYNLDYPPPQHLIKDSNFRKNNN
jgi:hypothetical protein